MINAQQILSDLWKEHQKLFKRTPTKILVGQEIFEAYEASLHPAFRYSPNELDEQHRGMAVLGYKSAQVICDGPGCHISVYQDTPLDKQEYWYHVQPSTNSWWRNSNRSEGTTYTVSRPTSSEPYWTTIDLTEWLNSNNGLVETN